jgi:phospholipase A-2-activating protein
MSASPAYALRAECRGHEDDVRGVAVVAPDAFATCSRDKTVRVWREAIGDDGYATAAVCVGHTSFVTALARVPADATPSLPSGGLVSGSRDKSVIVWNDATNEPVAKLAGHSLDVTAVCVMRDGTIVSGAMDKSIRMWDASSGKCVRTIADAHGSSVLALLALPDSDGFLSGSADKTIKRWDIGHTTDSGGNASSSLTPSKTITGHADTVRGLALMPNVGFLSASHDCTARLWTLEGETVCVFIGHAALVYSASCVSVSSQTGSLVITGSEDNTAKLWNPNDGSCLQTIKHPGCVWAVSAFPSGGDGENGGDVVTCCADGVARVWTRAEKRKNHGAQRALDDMLIAVAELKAQASVEEQRKKIKTEPPESLHAPGEADGQTKVIAETGGSIAAYAWSAGTQSWERLGEVTGVDDDSGGKRKTLDGVSYDFVFDVDIQEGAPVLKLPFNVGDNPYDAAERFLETNGLDPGYREQVVNFIVQNVGEDAFAGAGANVSADPFTGAGAYVPGTGVTTGAGAHRSADPFTGAGAYVPSANAPKAGGSSNATFKYVPAKPHQCVVFPTATSSFDKMLAKTKELGATEEELQAFARAASVADGSDTAAAMDLNSTRVLEKALNDWPVESLFPLLDLCKALSLRFDEKRLQSELSGSTATAMMAACARASRPPATAPNLLTAARLFANAFKCETTRRVFLLNASQILDGLAAATTADAKPALRLALATALLNFAAHFEPNKSDDEAIAAREVAPQAAAVGAELLMNATDLAANDGAESDASAVVFRALVALGTLAAKSAETKSLLRDLGVRELADSLARSRPEGKTNVASAAEDVKKALAE